MSSFKNSKPRRKYRQRAQPQSRQHLGLLQKHIDYKQRAKNYNQKSEKLRKLKLKANLKNEDQYYFKMNKSKTKDGKVIQFDSDQSDIQQKEYRKQLKTENSNIVTMQYLVQANKSRKLLSELHFVDAPKINKHIIFMDQQQKVRNFKLNQFYNTIPQAIEQDRPFIYTKQQLQNMNVEEIDRNEQTKQKYKKLQQTLSKEQKMLKMMNKIQYQKNLLGKQRRKIKKMKGQKVHKFFMQRKR